MATLDGIEISVLTEKDFDEVVQYFIEEFLPDEPIMSTINVMEGNGFFDKIVQKEVQKEFLMKSLQGGASFGARNQDGTLVGVRLGQIMTPTTVPEDKSVLWMLKLPKILVPRGFEKLTKLETLMKACDYSYPNAFKQCEDNNGKIYIGFSLGTAKSVRGKGLGGVLLRESIQHAKEQGCSHQYLLASGIYSQAVMTKNGFVTVKEVPYAEAKGRGGKQIVNDPVHKSMKVMSLKIE